MTINDQANESLDLVSRELNSTLDTARREIESYLDGQSSTEALLRAAGMLHLACGALKIVELNGAALLAEEMEQTCQRLTEIEDSEEVERGVDVLTRAMIQLPAYLERLTQGGRDVALVLLPLLNELREFRSKPTFSEGTLLGLSAGPFAHPSEAVATSETVDVDEAFRATAVKQRPLFQAALLGLIRGEQVERNLEQLISASTALEEASGAKEIEQLWEVLTAVLAALRDNGLAASVTLKRLIGQADRQLKRLIDVGVSASADAPPIELINNLLYYVARAASEDERVLAVRRKFHLDDTVPGDDQIERAREDLAGPSVKLLRTVADAIKEDLSKVKDVLDIFVRTGLQDVQQLKPQLEMLKKISDTLGVLGLESSRTRIQNETRQLMAIVNEDSVSDPTVLEQIAATMLEVEDALDRELVRTAASAGSAAEDGEDEERTHYRHVTQAVVGECIVNLSRIKDVVTRIVDGAAEVRSVDKVMPQLKGIVAGLLMLNKTRAVAIVERIGAVITQRLAPGEPPLKPDYLERLADAIVSVEYYMETISLGRGDPWYMLDNAERCIALLESLPAGSAPAEREAAPAASIAAREPPSVMHVQEDGSDPEILEVFIEEAKEELANIRSHLPLWLDNVENTEALISVRRSFHTLKGSGRTVGAQLLGEFAWSVENLLNRLINQTLEPTPAMLSFIGEAVDAVSPLVEQLEIGITPDVDVDLLMKQADAFAAGDPAAERLTSESVRVPVLEGDEADEQMDPVLTEIFVKETRGHLATLADFLAEAESHSPPHAVTEPLYRACHTLLGSARMADCRAAIEFAKPLHEHVARHYEHGLGLGDEGLALLRTVSDELETMANTLAAGEAYTANAELVERMDELGTAPAPEREAGPAAEPESESAAGARVRSEPESERALEHEPELGAEFELEGESGIDSEIDFAIEPERAFVDAAPEPEVGPADEQRADDGAFVPASEPPGLESPGEAELERSLEPKPEPEPEPEPETEPEREPEPEPEPEPEIGGFDPEIAGIFADEAAEILEQAETTLAELKEGSVGVGDGIGALKRQLHTLKGGARMAGVLPMGDLSHALETLLASVGPDSTTLSGAALDLIQRCLDQLHAMRDGVDGGRVLDTPPGLLEQVQSFADLEASAAPSEPEAPAAEGAPDLAAAGRESPLPPADETGAAGAAPSVPFEAETRAGAPESPTAYAAYEADADELPEAYETAATPEAADVPEAWEAEPADEPDVVFGVEEAAAAEREAGGLEAESEAAAAPAADVPATPRSAERAETARVSAELLDSMLNGAGEISIFQSRLNQQLQSIEFHLGELGQTVTRLREQLRKLEAETEAQILHRHQDDAEQDAGFDPLELDRYSTIQQLSRALAETANDVASINELLYGLTTETDTLLTQQSRVTAELQDGLMQTRMVSFQRHVARLARIVRQASAETGKQAELSVEGAQSELDRHVLDSILPALEHLLRNAVVHGIEKPDVRRRAGKPEAGTVTLNLRREGTEVLVDVSDDGAGLDLDAIRRKAVEQGLLSASQSLSEEEARDMILKPGFSTAGHLTQAAGRGVGMDVADNEVKKLGGSMRIESTSGAGTRFLIRLPYTLAITHALIVDVGEETFALPLPTVEGITRVRREQLLEILTDDEPRLDYGDVSYRVQHLGSLVGSAPSALGEDDNAVSLVLVRAGEHSTALLTDSIEGSREIVVKTLGPHLLSVPGVSGATILGDGRIIVILDPGTLVRQQAGHVEQARIEAPVERQLTALVVDDSITMRRVTQRLLERRGVRVLTARDGLDAISVLQESDADVILLDIEMPRMDGYQFATHVRNDPRLKDLPIIMVTSRSSQKHRARAIEIGVNDYLSKPYQESQLVAAIEGLIGRTL